METNLPPLTYPVFSWYENYIHLASSPLELCTQPRSLFDKSVRRARAGKDHLIDSEGRYFDVVDWCRIRPFSVTGFLLLIIGTISATPVLANEMKLSLPDFKETLARAIKSRYRYDGDKHPAVESIKNIQAADSYRAALDAVPWP